MTNTIAVLITTTLITNWSSHYIYYSPDVYKVEVGRIYTNLTVKVDKNIDFVKQIPSDVFIYKQSKITVGGPYPLCGGGQVTFGL